MELKTGDEIRLQFLGGDRYEVVSVPSPAYPRVYRSKKSGYVRVCFDATQDAYLFVNNSQSVRSCANERALLAEVEAGVHTLLTGPEAAEYVAAARENRDAVWPPKVEWPKVARNSTGWWVWFSHGDGVHRCCGVTISTSYKDIKHCSSLELGIEDITGTPEAEKAITLAREWREKQQAKESDPWPHWYLDDGDDFLVRHDNEVSGECWEISGPHADGNPFATDPEETEAFHKAHGYRRIPSSEATALIAKWQAKPQPAPLPTAEEVAEKVVTQQCGIGRPAAYDPDQQIRLSYAVGLVANAIHHDRRLRESTQRVKHDWTGAMGTVLMEHDGTAFVKWDDGQVTSVYNRHLQKELQ